MFSLGPIDFVVASFLAIRRFGLLRSTLGALALLAAYSYAQPPRSCGCFRPLFTRCSNVPRYLVWVKSDLKNLASQQEIFYSDAYAYSADPNELAFTHSQGVEVTIVATADGWSASATHAALEEGQGCRISVGSAESVDGRSDSSGSPNGEVVCTT